MKRYVLFPLICVIATYIALQYTVTRLDHTSSRTSAAPVVPTVAQEADPEQKQGTVTLVAKDSEGFPIAGARYTIRDATTSKVVGTLTTDTRGRAESDNLNVGDSYTLQQDHVPAPFVLDPSVKPLRVEAESQEIAMRNEIPAYIAETARGKDGKLEIKKVAIDVKTLMQLPELPNGCEITSLTAVLNYYGYSITKTKMADAYLPKQPFSQKNGKLYGPDPDDAYAGNPREDSGFFSFAPPIAQAANAYFKSIGDTGEAIDLTGSTKEQLIEQLNEGNPVVVWTTLDLSKPNMTYGWYLRANDAYFTAPRNLHAVVLSGYDGDTVHIMNPLQGQVDYPADAFFNSYAEMGKRAVIVRPSERA